jgi:hypothetical protein
LRTFKAARRKSDIMFGPASAITDDQIVELARYFSDQQVKPYAVKDPQLAAIGARIYRYPSRAARPAWPATATVALVAAWAPLECTAE